MSVIALLAFGLLSQKTTLPADQRPYLQLGQSKSDELEILWQTPRGSDAGAIEWSPEGEDWRPAEPLRSYDIAVAPHPAMILHRVKVSPKLSSRFRYRLTRAGQTLFASTGHARPAEGRTQTFAIFGDCARGTAGQASIAYQTSLLDPEYVVIPGDIVYDHGTMGEYRDRFFPFYNADQPALDKGAPLLARSTFVGVPGNHDTGAVDTAKYSDLWGYFIYWSQPLNGPLSTSGMKGTPVLSGPGREAIERAAGNRAPVMANFSFDMGDVHWLVLDSNPYGDFKGATLRNWIDADLKATTKKWKFVTFHHPPFHSSAKHAGDTYMRSLHELFLADHVDVVWSGHVHNYQVSHPIGAAKGSDFALDMKWDGDKQTKPNGIVYVVEGAGGAPLYDAEYTDQPDKWKPFTKTYKASFSFGLVTVSGDQMRLTQRDSTGRVIDSWSITKS